LLYVGPVVLIYSLPEPQYANLLTLSVAIRLCLSLNVSSSFIEYADELLRHFVKTFSLLYGESQLVYNVHGLLHLVDDVRRYGTLDNVSAFQFESYLGMLKKKVRSPKNPIAQIVHRISEDYARIGTGSESGQLGNVFKKLHLDGPVPISYMQCSQYKQHKGAEFFISTACNDNCFEVEDRIGFVRNVLCDESSNQGFIVFESFETIEPLFVSPLPSNRLSIYYVARLSGIHDVFPISQISSKFMSLPLKQGFAVFPLLHHSIVG
jgi:hypothetical protein